MGGGHAWAHPPMGGRERRQPASPLLLPRLTAATSCLTTLWACIMQEASAKTNKPNKTCTNQPQSVQGATQPFTPHASPRPPLLLLPSQSPLAEQWLAPSFPLHLSHPPPPPACSIVMCACPHLISSHPSLCASISARASAGSRGRPAMVRPKGVMQPSTSMASNTYS